MKKILLFLFIFFIIIINSISFTGCNNNQLIKLYNIENKTITNININDYLAGDLAGEMNNEWPLEALKAQCILARTFTFEFLKNKQSKYQGADISTDISEAQAYNKELINNKIRKAVNETDGLVIKHNNELINAYFHSNSGGITDLATIGFNYTEENPNYIKSTTSPENNKNSENYNWEYTFYKSDILKALSSIGVEVNTITNVSIEEKSNTGRVITIKIGDKTVNANTFRSALGTTKLKSTLITNIKVDSNNITFTGLGYGHGVGMSQWGAKLLADSGKDYTYILNYYFKNIQIVKN